MDCNSTNFNLITLTACRNNAATTLHFFGLHDDTVSVGTVQVSTHPIDSTNPILVHPTDITYVGYDMALKQGFLTLGRLYFILIMVLILQQLSLMLLIKTTLVVRRGRGGG